MVALHMIFVLQRLYFAYIYPSIEMGKPGKLKSGTHVKLKKWRKGSACASNPETKTHRNQARSRFFHKQPISNSTKSLTCDTLKVHNELINQGVIKVDPTDACSEGEQTFGSFLSGLSDCTNVTFCKIQRFWLNNSSKHKEVCAVLAAITEVIREQGGAETNTAYFAALVTALGSVEKLESATAVAYLLSITCKQVPVAVLRAKYGDVSKLLFEILGQNIELSNSAPTALVRSVLSCLSTILRQQDVSVWVQPSTMNIFHAILTLAIHSKPKIRKAAQNAACAILLASSFLIDGNTKVKTHPAAKPTAEFCVTHLEKFGGASCSSSVCHVLSLLGRVFHTFSQKSLKSSCETVLRLMTLSDPIVKSCCLQTLHSLFVNQPSIDSFPPSLVAQILTALYDCHPNSSDTQICPPWLAVMEKGVLHLSLEYLDSKDFKEAANLALAHVLKLNGMCFKLLLSPNRAVCLASSSCLETVIKKACSILINKVDEESQTNFVQSCVKLFEDGLKYKYHSVWDLIFGIFKHLFEKVLRPTDFHMVKDFICNLSNIRNSPMFAYKNELDTAVGSFVANFGPKVFLQAVPLNIDGTETEYNFPRSWILPMLATFVGKCELQFFTEYFLSLAAKLRTKALEMKSQNFATEAKVYETLQYQCWNLLPVFCHGATDLSKAFPGLARVLGHALTDQPDLRLVVMQGLRNVLTRCKESENDLKVVSRFAKNYLPILFNLYTTSEVVDSAMNESEKQLAIDANKRKTPERLAALETIKLYLPLADHHLILSYFAKAKSRVFDGENESDATRLALLDLLINMVTYVTLDQIYNIYKAVCPMLSSPNHSMQKKAYRLLEELCGSTSSDCQQFVNNHLQDLKSRLLIGLSSSSPSAKGPRICCMEQIVRHLSSNNESHGECIEFIQAVIPEVVLCTKEAKRSRTAAFNLLVTAASACMACYPESKLKGLNVYFEIVFAGLAGSPDMIKSTIIAVCRLVYEFRNTMPSELLDQTIKNVCILLGCNTREVCKASLSFVMVLCSILDRPTLAQYAQTILDSLLNWKPETRRHFRFQVKKVLQRFVQKFGFETVFAMTPEAHRKQLQNIRKLQERTKKAQNEKKKTLRKSSEMTVDSFDAKQKKETIDELLESSSDSEDEKEKNKHKPMKRSAGKAWLQDNQNDPLDLLDPSVSQQVLAVNPATAKQKPRSNDFDIAPDGRLIIPHDVVPADEDKETKKILGISNLAKSLQNSVKRKHDSDLDDSDDESGLYKPGGKGIHRDVDTEETGSFYRAKKAGGDVKYKGKDEPYAYVPLNRGMLNKRKRKKLSGQYEGLVKAVKKSSISGEKLRVKSKRKHV